jgi:hypothetical protein
VFFGWAAYSHWIGENSEEWVPTKALITAGRHVKIDVCCLLEFLLFLSSLFHSIISFQIAWSMGRQATLGFQYEYEVNGQKFVGKRYRVGHSWYWMEPIPWHLKARPDLLTPGNEVCMFVNVSFVY